MSMWVSGAAIGAGGSIIGSLISSSGAQQSAASAAQANLQNTQATNAANLNLFNLGRGAINPATGYGSAVLPEYMGANEQAMGQQAYGQFQQLSGLAQNNYNASTAYQNQLGGAANAATTNLANRFNGQYLQQQQQYSNPYYQSVLQNASTQGTGLRQVAAANSSAINTGLAQSLAQINAQQASQGFLGGSTYNQNRMASATIGARQAAAVNNAQANSQANNLTSAAQLSNAGDLRSLQLSNLDYASNPNNLSSGMSALSTYQNAPANALSQAYTAAQSPMNFFRISPQSTSQAPMPTQTPQINGSEIAGSALTQGASSYANYQLMNQLSQMYGTNGAAANPYTSAAAASSLANAYQPSLNSGVGSFLNYAGTAPGYSGSAGYAPGFNYQQTPISMYNPGM